MIRVTVQTTSNDIIPAMIRGSESFAARLTHNIALKGQEFAKENVAPGKGPGPHPHRPQSRHNDTATLQEAIRVVDGWGGDMLFEGDMPSGMSWISSLTIDPKAINPENGVPAAEYGLYLEMGWTTKSGTHYRYPWMFPAMTNAQRQFKHLAQTIAMRWIEQYQRGYAKIGKAPLSSTLWPE